MYIETKVRSLLKAISWRFFATLTTTTIIFVFFGRLDLAIAAGLVELLIKIMVYFIHERIWYKIKIGKKKVEPFVIWFTGLPKSGKTVIADKVFEKLKKYDYVPIERIDSKDIRDLLPEIGFDRESRKLHLKRVGILIKILQKNSTSVIASFVSPYKETRECIKGMTENFIEIFVKASVETCIKRDDKGVYKEALEGKRKNFTGVSDNYDEPENPEIVLDTENLLIEESADIVFEYIKKRFYKDL
jgi:adenylylsulfate kinase